MLTTLISGYKADLLPRKQNIVDNHQLLLIWNHLIHIQCGIWEHTLREPSGIFPPSPPEGHSLSLRVLPAWTPPQL